jgi:hypothetical protein
MVARNSSGPVRRASFSALPTYECIDFVACLFQNNLADIDEVCFVIDEKNPGYNLNLFLVHFVLAT